MSPMARPAAKHSTKSFSRYQPLTELEPRSEYEDASSRPGPTKKLSANAIESLLTKVDYAHDPSSDIFDAQDSDGDHQHIDESHAPTLPESFDQLPIEILSLMERFLDSLTAKVHPAPLNIDQLSQLYQDFYITVEPHIATHVAALATRLGRDKSPTPSTQSASSSKAPSLRTQKSSDGSTPERQMLTVLEVADKRRLRRQLELKRAALEDSVEQGVCEKVYSSLWRHKSADDGERDEKLRSRAAALGLVGVGLVELLSTSKGDDAPQPKLPSGTEDASEFIRLQLQGARNSIAQMDEETYPVGKLKHLSQAHKEVVDFLSQIFPSSSSADEVLPTFIYAIITSHPDALNLISNLNFIQRFRAAGKITGEEAYCLTNLEAAITFLDTVDLSQLRPNSTSAEGQASTPRSEKQDPLYRGLSSTDVKAQKTLEPPTSPSRSRRFSQLMPGARPLEAADSAIDVVQSALDGSLKFFFGRLKEKQQPGSPFGSPDLSAPKTLEDARKLMSSPKASEDDAASLSERSLADPADSQKTSADRKVLELVGGRPRRPSTDSTKSAGSTKKVAFAHASKATTTTETVEATKEGSWQASHSPQSSLGSAAAAVESVRSFSSTFNPLRASWGLRTFGRSTPGTGTPTNETPPATAVDSAKDAPVATSERSSFDFSGLSPAIKRFVDLKESKELNGFDVEMLLRDYQRLAGALAAAGLQPPV